MPKVDHIKCKFCKVPIHAKVWQQHIAGKKHKGRTPAQILVQAEIADNGQIDQVHAYFGAFGALESKSAVIINKEKNIVSLGYVFLNKMVHTVVAHQDHVLFGKQVNMSFNRKRMVQQVEANGVGGSDELGGNNPLNNFITTVSDTIRIKNCPFAEQITIFENLLRIANSETEEARLPIFSDLTASLKNICSDYRVMLFGSTEASLNIPNSGLDFYIYNIKVIDKLPTLQSMQSMISHSGKFENVITSTQDGIGMIICTHTPTRILCRITGSKIMRRSDELVKYYASLDEKIRQLILVVKCLCNRHHLVKSCRFSNYALYLLIIFFLQQEPYNLPRVIDLEIRMRWEVEKGWTCAFSPPQFTSQALKTATILELVNSFLKFYSDFDYVSYVISPYCGYPIAKTSFLKPYDLPACYDNYMHQENAIDLNGGLCIQDPFQHSKNLLSKVCLSHSGNFITWCRESLTFNQTKPGLLSKSLIDLGRHGFTVLRPNTLTKQQWKSSVEKITLDILRKIFCYEVSVSRTGSTVRLVCKGDHDLWIDRCGVLKRLLPMLPSSATDIEKEIAVTAQMLCEKPTLIKKRDKPTAIINITFEKNLSSAKFWRERMNKYKKHFDHYLRLKITNWLKETNDMVVASPDTTQHVDSKPDVLSNGGPETHRESSVFASVVPKSETLLNGIKDVIPTEEHHIDVVSSSGQCLANRSEQEQPNSNPSIDEPIAINLEDDWASDNDAEPEDEFPSEFFQDFTRDSFLDGLDFDSECEDINPSTECDQLSPFESPTSEVNLHETTQKRPRSRSTSTDRRFFRSPLPLSSKKMRYSWESPETKSNKILSRCEEALRVMNYQQLKRLHVSQTRQTKPQKLSPLFKTKTSFSFTTPLTDIARSPFADALLKILHSIGILSEPNDISSLVDSITEDVALGDVVDKAVIAKILQISLLSPKASERRKTVDAGTQCKQSKNIVH